MADDKRHAEKRLQILESQYTNEQIADVKEELGLARHLEERPFCV
jgi:hypothetical protein